MNCEACGHENIDGARFCAGCGALLPTEHQGEDPFIGQIVGGRYRITRVLGEGGMGIVYEGEQQMGSTVRKVAVKTLHAHLSKDPSVLARFHRECGTVAQLEHPNTIKFYDFGATADGTLYIAMEFVKGEPLNDVIEKGGAMPPDRCMKIMKQVCGALDEAHGQGVIHRDLKPENVILSTRAGESDFVKVLDFGIAARSEGADAEKEQKLTQQGMVLGTPPYMSPEQFTGKQLDSRSDIYSLGVMAYEMLTGRLPFEADTPWQWATQHMTAQPLPFDTAAPSSAAIPEVMRTAIMRALSKERDERQKSATEFFEELSGGGGLTIDQPAMSGGETGTAQMAAAPDFSGPPPTPPAAAMTPPPAAPPAAAPGPAGPVTPPGVANVPPPPPPARSQGGGKGLVIGLGAIGGVLLIAIVVVVARGLGDDTGDDQPLTNPFTADAAPETTVQADPTGQPPPTATESADDDGTSPSSGTGGTTSKPTTGTGGSTVGKTPVRPPGTGGTGGGSTTKPPGTGGGTSGGSAAACSACIAAAKSGNIPGAAAQYNRCNNAGQKSTCARYARSRGAAQARNAENNGNCPQAKAIANAARSMGANIVLRKCK